MVMNPKPHPTKPFEQVHFSPEPGIGMVTQVLPKPDPEPPEFVCILSPTWKNHQVSAPFPIYDP